MPEGDGSKIRNTGLYPCNGGLLKYNSEYHPHWHGTLAARIACQQFGRVHADNPLFEYKEPANG